MIPIMQSLLLPSRKHSQYSYALALWFVLCCYLGLIYATASTSNSSSSSNTPQMMMPTSVSGVDKSSTFDSFQLTLSPLLLSQYKQMKQQQQQHATMSSTSSSPLMIPLSSSSYINPTDTTYDELKRYPYGKTFSLSFQYQNVGYEFVMSIDTLPTDGSIIQELGPDGDIVSEVYALPHVYHATGVDTNGDDVYITTTLRLPTEVAGDISSLSDDDDDITSHIIMEGSLITPHGIYYLTHIPTTIQRAQSEMVAYQQHKAMLVEQQGSSSHATMSSVGSPFGALAAEIAVYDHTISYLDTSIHHLSSLLSSDDGDNHAPQNIAIMRLGDSPLNNGLSSCNAMNPETGEADHVHGDHGHHHGDHGDHGDEPRQSEEHPHGIPHHETIEHIAQSISDSIQSGSMQSLFDRTTYLNRFTSCHANIDNKVKKVNMLFTLTYGYSQMANGSTTAVITATDPATLAHFRNALSLVNSVYVRQLGLYLFPTVVQINTTYGTQPWNSRWPHTLDATRCNTSTILTNYSTYASTLAATNPTVYRDYALYHLFTACNPSGVVGTAWIGTACFSNIYYRTGWSVVDAPSTWLTVAHEIGHNYNLPHPFTAGSGLCTLGQGNCGGIMDYSTGYIASTDSLNPGKIGFSAAYDKTPFCTGAATTISNANGNCYSDLTVSTCNNNGIVEPGEECDDTSSCCNNCKLVAGATCSGPNTTCCQSCQAQPMTTACTKGTLTGWCGVKGQCISSVCETPCPVPANSWSFPTLTAQCVYTCKNSANTSCGTYSSNGYMPSGSVCQFNATTKGVCVEKAMTTANLFGRDLSCEVPVYSWNTLTVVPCNCPSVSTQIRDVSCTDQTGNTVAASFCPAASKPATSVSCGC